MDQTVRIKMLSYPALVAFCASVCERMLPLHAHFTSSESWGDTTVLRRAVDLLWELAEVSDMRNTCDFAELRVACRNQIPSSEDFETNGSTHAQNAACAVCSGLDAAAHFDPAAASIVATYAIDAIDMYIMIREDAELPDRSLRHRLDADVLMVAELERQQSGLAILETIAEGDDAAVHRFRVRSSVACLFCVPGENNEFGKRSDPG